MGETSAASARALGRASPGVAQAVGPDMPPGGIGAKSAVIGDAGVEHTSCGTWVPCGTWYDMPNVLTRHGLLLLLV